MRPYSCPDCPPGTVHEASLRGPLPDRCPPHRRTRDRETARDRSFERKRTARKGKLHVVDPEPVAPARQPSAEAAQSPGPVLKALRSDLQGVFSRHPAAGTLASVAEVLAEVLDSPVTQADGRIMAAVSKELRGVVHELTSAEAAEADDLFTGAGPTVVRG